MNGFVKWFNELVDGNERELKKYRKRVDAINALESKVKNMSEKDIKDRIKEIKEEIEKKGNDNTDPFLNEVFALVREASVRTIGLRHFDVQLIGGMVLNQGRISEMKTGEGKTLVATLPVALNALCGKGAHVVTVNDYLAKRDSSWMGAIYHYLGLSVASIQHEEAFIYDPEYVDKDATVEHMRPISRKEAYDADITYGTNNEFGFDYLRDNMVMELGERVQRGRFYAIVDEVDSILIDEARTPLIISGRGAESTDLYVKFFRLVKNLVKDVDYTVDEKAKTAPLTDEGVIKIEEALHIENLYDNENMELSHHVNQALRAKELYKKDVDYVVKDGEVIIVDENTGRLMFGRRYSDGLHQAIEAKEGMKVRSEDQTLASITFQNYFRLYKKLCGMTGTAKTEEREFREIYNLDVVVIPTNKENIRKDYPDAVYKTEKGKFKAVINLIKELHEKGQPVLVGTRSIEKSELLSKMLKTEGIPHQVLNAKYHEKEASIIAQAGRKGAVTIATNMAGRGVDILLGGNPPESDDAQDEVKKLGGLYIIGTERHESRRIDNQLRGRSGRQGDPGATKFFVSFEDELMRLFGAENISKFMDNFKLDFSEDDVIEHPFVTKAIENAQKKVEMRYFDMRKSVLDYDNVMNEQRTEIYGDRDQILKGEKLKESVISMIENLASSIVDSHASSETHSKTWDYDGIIPDFADKFPFEGESPLNLEELKKITTVDKLTEFVAQKAVAIYEKKESDIGEGLMRELERFALLRILDEKWIDHLYSMDILRDGIHLRAYGQKDPRIEYVNEAYQAFQELQFRIQEDTVKFLFRIKFRSSDEVPQQRQQRRNMHTNREGDEAPAKPYRRNGAKVGRNDLCPCGSGKKYKNCCGAK